MRSAVRAAGALRVAGGGAVVFLALMLVNACAKVGEPLPPVHAVPAVQDLRIEADPQRVLLSFPLPQAEVSALEVWLSCGPDSPAQGDFQLFAALPVSRLVADRRDPQRRTFAAQRNAASSCFYRIRFINPSGNRSAFSNTVRTP